MKKKKIFNKIGQNAVSEVIGVIMLLVITIALFSIVAVVVLSFPFNPPIPSVDIIGYINDDFLIIEHCGGENLNLDTKIFITINYSQSYNTTVRNQFEDEEFKDYESLENNYWNIGETVFVNLTSIFNFDITNSYIELMIIDVDNNSVLLMNTLQEAK